MFAASLPRMSYKQRALIERNLLLTPGVLLYGIFNLFPLFCLPFMALVDWPGLGDVKFTGVANFKEIFFNDYYRSQLINAIWQNILFFVFVMAAMLSIGTGLALLLSFGVHGRNAYRFIYFLPYPIAGVAIAFLMELMVQQNGPINTLLVKYLGLADSPVPFLGSEETALFTLSSFYAWHRMGFAVMLILSAVLAVRISLIEAAMLDGASRLQTIRTVIVPTLAPAFVLITVIVMVDVFNNADYTLILMGPEAGPNRATDVMGTFLYRTAFGGAATTTKINFGMAAAIGLITALVVLPAALFLALRNLRRS